MKTPIRDLGRAGIRGFTLIEILIAVVILATGLLALTALQGRLAQASAEAKTRSRVAAMLSARMDELRVGQYGNAALDVSAGTGSTVTNFSCTSGAPAWLCTTQAESGVTGLGVRQQVDRYTSAVGATSFTVSGTAAANVSIPEFKRITLLATWTDATGVGRRLSVTSDVSPLSIGDSRFRTEPTPGSGGGTPTVRQDSPETAGVIPIALGDGNSTAASNPKPELKGSKNNQTITGTTFNVLTYVPGGTSAVIQKRFENEVIKCSCQYGAAGSGFSNLGEIYRKAQWPAVWTGGRYDVYESANDAPGTAYVSGPASGVTQSDLCTECCRDHHDTNTSGVAKFDPERFDASGGTSKYDASLTAVTNTSSGQYVNACRVIRVDGFWRVASDMYSRQMGLLETETVGGTKAKTGLPTSTAKTAYEAYVKDYLDGYTGTSGTAPSGAQAMFDESARGLNAPNQVNITAPSNTDYRYLHDRGLYVDYLEADARTAVSNAITRCATGTPLADCILPVLPFTTINLTEIAKWTASVPSIITVNSGSLLTNNPTEPSGGRTYGKADGDSDNTAEMRISNSGVAVNTALAFNGVDPSDSTTVQTDAQAFHVGSGGNSGNPTGESFNLVQSDGGLDPSAFFTIGTDTNVECFGPKASKVCDPNASASPWSGSIKLSKYWALTTASDFKTPVYFSSGNTKYYTVDGVTCTGDTQSGGDTQKTVSVPIFINYQVNTVTVTGSGSITSSLPAAADVSPGDNVQAETTTIAFTGLTTGSTINVGYSEQNRTTVNTPGVTVAGCAMTKSGNNWTLSISSWNVPWD